MREEHVARAIAKNSATLKHILAVSLVVVSTVYALPAAVASSQTDLPTSSSVCEKVKAQQAPESIDEWLMRSRYAHHCYLFQARAVAIDALGVRTLALSHRIHDGIRQQVVQHLDGPSVSVERRSLWGQPGQLGVDDSGGYVSARSWVDLIDDNYAMTLDDDTRVAGRAAALLHFSPYDESRYHHQWWLDKETGLLLKAVLRNAQGSVLETFQITQLQSPELYEGDSRLSGTEPPSHLDWQVGWVPDGFMAQPASSDSGDANQRFFSDGLVSFSVFAQPVSHVALDAGVRTIGVTSVAVALSSREGQHWKVVGVGELPPAQMLRIVESVDTP